MSDDDTALDLLKKLPSGAVLRSSSDYPFSARSAPVGSPEWEAMRRGQSVFLQTKGGLAPPSEASAESILSKLKSGQSLVERNVEWVVVSKSGEPIQGIPRTEKVGEIVGLQESEERFVEEKPVIKKKTVKVRDRFEVGEVVGVNVRGEPVYKYGRPKLVNVRGEPVVEKREPRTRTITFRYKSKPVVAYQSGVSQEELDRIKARRIVKSAEEKRLDALLFASTRILSPVDPLGFSSLAKTVKGFGEAVLDRSKEEEIRRRIDKDIKELTEESVRDIEYKLKEGGEQKVFLESPATDLFLTTQVYSRLMGAALGGVSSRLSKLKLPISEMTKKEIGYVLPKAVQYGAGGYAVSQAMREKDLERAVGRTVFFAAQYRLAEKPFKESFKSGVNIDDVLEKRLSDSKRFIENLNRKTYREIAKPEPVRLKGKFESDILKGEKLQEKEFSDLKKEIYKRIVKQEVQKYKTSPQILEYKEGDRIKYYEEIESGLRDVTKVQENLQRIASARKGSATLAIQKQNMKFYMSPKGRVPQGVKSLVSQKYANYRQDFLKVPKFAEKFDYTPDVLRKSVNIPKINVLGAEEVEVLKKGSFLVGSTLRLDYKPEVLKSSMKAPFVPFFMINPEEIISKVKMKEFESLRRRDIEKYSTPEEVIERSIREIKKSYPIAVHKPVEQVSIIRENMRGLGFNSGYKELLEGKVYNRYKSTFESKNKEIESLIIKQSSILNNKLKFKSELRLKDLSVAKTWAKDTQRIIDEEKKDYERITRTPTSRPPDKKPPTDKGKPPPRPPTGFNKQVKILPAPIFFGGGGLPKVGARGGFLRRDLYREIDEERRRSFVSPAQLLGSDARQSGKRSKSVKVKSMRDINKEIEAYKRKVLKRK